MIAGACHCGAVSVTLARKPDYINLCDCSLCAKSGGAWGYFSPTDVTIDGETRSYRRADYNAPAVEMRFCSNCGTTTHWITTENIEVGRIGVNMRVFQPAECAGIEARFPDGRNWNGQTDPAHRRTHGILGQDAFL